MELSKIVQESVESASEFDYFELPPGAMRVEGTYKLKEMIVNYIGKQINLKKLLISSQISLIEAHKEIIEARIRTLLNDKNTRLEVPVMSKVTELKQLITYLTEQIELIKKMV
jgi:hypothetical protein